MRFSCFLFLTFTILCSSFATAEARKNHVTTHPSPKNSIVTTPVDGEVCFSPKMPCDQKLIKFIDSAEKSLDIAIFDVNLDELVHHILVQSKKIPVRIVVDKRQAKGTHSLVGTLIKGGANVKFGHQKGIFHDKFSIVDGKMIETGSFNYTNHATSSNQENQVYLSNPAIVKQYEDQFNEIWNDAKEAVIK